MSSTTSQCSAPQIPTCCHGSATATRQEQVTIRVPDDAASVIAASADGGKVWLVLRPAVGARAHRSDTTLNGVNDGAPLNADVNIKVRTR